MTQISNYQPHRFIHGIQYQSQHVMDLKKNQITSMHKGNEKSNLKKNLALHMRDEIF